MEIRMPLCLPDSCVIKKFALEHVPYLPLVRHCGVSLSSEEA